LSFRRKPESSFFNESWTPAFAGVTLQKCLRDHQNLKPNVIVN
jgi:hypothetical protein